MVWRASFPLQSLRDFKHPCTAVFPSLDVYSKYFHVDRSGDEEKFRARVCKFSVWKLAGYKNYTSFELEIHLTVYFFYFSSFEFKNNIVSFQLILAYRIIFWLVGYRRLADILRIQRVNSKRVSEGRNFW